MTTNLQHKSHVQMKPNVRSQRQTQLREDANAILRDLAFVLKMTQKVRAEIETEQKSPTHATV